MNHLQFSPILEKDEESLEMLSFLQSRSEESQIEPTPLSQRNSNKLDSHSNKQRLHLHPVKVFYLKLGLEKIAPAFSKACHRRKCYSFQVLKQFFLFSSSQESLSINYKYMRHELEGVADKLQNTIGIEYKITLGKAFQDIREFCQKRKVYQDQSNITTLVDKTNAIFKNHAYRVGFLRINDIELKSQRTVSKRKTGNHRSRKSSLANKSSRFVTAEFSDCEESAHDVEEFNLHEKQIKLNQIGETIMSEGIHSVASLLFQKSQSKFLATQPSNQKMKEDVALASILGNIYQRDSIKEDFSNELEQTEKIRSGELSKMSKTENARKAQDIIIVHTSRPRKRPPTRHIRVPIMGDDVNIIEIQPSNKRSGKTSMSRPSQLNPEIHLNLKEFLNQNEKNSWKTHNQPHLKYSSQKSHTSIHSSQVCAGCRFCSVIQEMEAFRLSRQSKRSLFRANFEH